MADISKEALRKEIAAILKNADLSTTTAKNVRQELEEKLDANLQSRKKDIDALVLEFVSGDKKKKGGKKAESEEDEQEEEEEEEEEEEADSADDKKKKRSSTAKKPAAKKAKKGSDESDASELSEDGESEDEYSPKSKSKPPKTRKLPPKNKKKGGSDSDSDEDSGKAKKGGKKAGAKRGGGGYMKALTLSPDLAALVGQDAMARHEVVKKVWSIIKEKDLYDPKNKQYAICDDALFKVIGVKRFRTFGMMKYLKNHFVV